MTSQGARNRANGRDYEAKVRRELQAGLEARGLDILTDIVQRNRSGYDGDDVGFHVFDDDGKELVVFSLDAKNTRAWEPAKQLDHATERTPEGELAAVIHRRRQRGSVEDHYALMSVGTLLDLIARLRGVEQR